MSYPSSYSDNSVVDYADSLKSLNLPLRVLIDNEVFRLAVWANPSNDPRRGVDQFGVMERTLTEVRSIVFYSLLVLNNFDSLRGSASFAKHGRWTLPSLSPFQSASTTHSSSAKLESWSVLILVMSSMSQMLCVSWLVRNSIPMSIETSR